MTWGMSAVCMAMYAACLTKLGHMTWYKAVVAFARVTTCFLSPSKSLNCKLAVKSAAVKE